MIIAFQFANEDFFGRLHLGRLANFLGADRSHFIFGKFASMKIEYMSRMMPGNEIWEEIRKLKYSNRLD
jgi:hypothetical protein